jgi:asparagine N-glycosylation enzyme membrane subunit Stt3
MDDSSEKRDQITKKIKELFKETDKEDSIDLSKQREELIKFMKTDKIYYILLLPILVLGWFVRTRNLPLLQGKYLLGLDPYAFFRYSQEIFETGTLVTHDMMRYVPWGYTLRMDYKFMSYVLTYCYKIIHIFVPSMSQIEWHIIYPPVITIISFVFFFLFVREMFDSKVALLATAFLSVIPTYIYRTGAGFADHEALAMLFMFIAFWLFSLMWKSENKIKSILFGALAGALTTATYFSWPGGYRFLVVSLALFGIMATLFTKLEKTQVIGYVAFVASFVGFSALGFQNITFIKEIENLALLFSVAILIANKIKPIQTIMHDVEKLLPYKVPTSLLILAALALVGLVVGWILGLIDISVIIGKLLHPGGTSRFAFTVSENQQPYFTGGNGWWYGFSWTFLLAFFGSIYMIVNMFKSLKVGLSVAGSYAIFIIIFIFGRFSPDAKYDKIASFSSSTYLGWFALFAITLFALYLYYYNKDKKKFSDIFNIHWGLMLTFIWFLFTAIIARGAVRTIFAFAPAVAIVASYFVVNLTRDLFKHNNLEKGLAIMLIIFTIFCIYNNSVQATMMNSNSGSGLPGQWEDSMTWIRDNTAEDAVIAHWWDYGYWTQTIGERATVLDGGNAMQWDHAMGRYGLTHNNLQETFEYFKTHKVTHLLISEEEISKYHAFSTIGSDENFDRRSTIATFTLKEEKELRDSTEYVYQGGWGLDQDMIIGMRVLPRGTPLGAITINQNKDGSYNAPKAYFFPNGQQVSFEVNCLVVGDKKLNFDVDQPIDACVVTIPYFIDQQNTHPTGAVIFASEKVHDGNLARLYLYNENIPGFKKVYDDGTPLGIYQNRIIGAIKIWEIQYPAGIEAKDSYLEKSIYG